MSAAETGAMEAVTILHARGRRLAKIVHPDGMIQAYDAARTVDLAEERIPDLAALECLLRDLVDRRDCCIVRGAIADPCRTRGVRRLLHPDLETGDAPTLRDEPRRWLALDIDSISRPADIAATNLPACATAAIDALPVPFRDARCIVQATASHGIKPGLRLRLWYWLDRPTTGAELKRWLRGAPVDHSVFGAAQIIYTAAPLFVAGARDSLVDRIAIMSGTIEAVSLPPASTLIPHGQPRAVKATIPDGHALAGLVQSIVRAAEGERNAVTFWAACRAGEMAATGLLGAETAAAVISHAAMQSGLPQAEAERTAWSGIRRGLVSTSHA